MEGINKSSESSIYNEAILQIQRLHEIWVSCRNNRKKGYYPRWKWELDQAEDELYFDAEKLDKDKKDNKFITSLKNINKEIEIATKNLSQVQLYSKLREKERILRRVQQESGKGGKYKSTDEDDLD